jgi:hypothetical protein
MKKYTIEDVYDTLCGEVHGEYAVPGVENAYADGGECDRLYNEMSQAYERLRDRLGVVDEDMDAEIMINSLLGIQRILCEKMFLYGQTL